MRSRIAIAWANDCRVGQASAVPPETGQAIVGGDFAALVPPYLLLGAALCLIAASARADSFRQRVEADWDRQDESRMIQIRQPGLVRFPGGELQWPGLTPASAKGVAGAMSVPKLAAPTLDGRLDDPCWQQAAPRAAGAGGSAGPAGDSALPRQHGRVSRGLVSHRGRVVLSARLDGRGCRRGRGWSEEWALWVSYEPGAESVVAGGVG